MKPRQCSVEERATHAELLELLGKTDKALGLSEVPTLDMLTVCWTSRGCPQEWSARKQLLESSRIELARMKTELKNLKSLATAFGDRMTQAREDLA